MCEGERKEDRSLTSVNHSLTKNFWGIICPNLWSSWLSSIGAAWPSFLGSWVSFYSRPSFGPVYWGWPKFLATTVRPNFAYADFVVNFTRKLDCTFVELNNFSQEKIAGFFPSLSFHSVKLCLVCAWLSLCGPNMIISLLLRFSMYNYLMIYVT